MSDRTLALSAPSLSARTLSAASPRRPWLARSTPNAAGSGGSPRHGAWFGLPDLGGSPDPAVARRPGLRAMLRAAWRRHRTRHCLADLDPYLLKDIGVSYAEAEAEANKPFWLA